jgi:hypothetical protein
MKNSKSVFSLCSFIVVALASTKAHAQIDCSQLLSTALSLQSGETNLYENVDQYLSSIFGTMQGWYGNMSSHEGQTSFIPVGEFAPIQESATAVTQTQSEYRQFNIQNTQLLDDLIDALPGCIKQ